MTTAEEHKICQPELSHYRRCPLQINGGNKPHIFTSAKAYFHQIYFEACDLLHGELEDRFYDRHIPSVLAIVKKKKN